MGNTTKSESRDEGSHKVATDLAVRNLQPRAARYIEWFREGFGVRVSPTGGKSFLYWYSFGGQKRMLVLGSYPATTVKEALAKHKEASLLRARGVDPVAKLAEAKAATEQAAAAVAARPTLRDTFALWLASLAPYTDAEGQRHGRKDGGAVLRLQFEKHVFPTLGDVALADLSRGAIVDLLDRVKATGKRRTAAVLFSTFRQFLDWCVDRERIENNTMAPLKRKKIVGKPTVRTRALDDWEVRRLLKRLPTVDLHAVTVLALRFVLATGQRPGEVSAMPKAELDKTGTLWTIPAARYKTNVAQAVPLSAHARGILAEAAKYNSRSAYVFPSPHAVTRADTDPDTCIDRHSLSRAVLRKLGTATPEDKDPADGELGLVPFRPHDLRRTCRTQLAKLRVPENVAERVLGHKPEGIVGTYDTHEYLDERREALELWGAKLDALGGNIQ
jgi:integrase